jgi:hypothetical protein
MKPEAKPLTMITGERHWTIRPGLGYDLLIPESGIYLSLSRIRRDKNETIGLLTARVKFRGALTVNGILSSADFNCSSLRARQERAKHLRERSRVEDCDWFGLLEELCLRVLDAEEEGEPEMPLEQVPLSKDSQVELNAGGLPLLRRHPTIFFGDGGSAKSYLALWAAIDLAQHGDNVLYLDWEFSAEEHRHRLHRLVGAEPRLSNLFYRRCDRAFCRDVTRIRDVIQRRNITFLICDSMGFAADGTPESAEAATNYYRALRELGPIGSLHLAHISKAEEGDKKPFGSVFWANGARNIWNLKRDDTERSDGIVPIGFYHRKSNIGELRAPFAMVARFTEADTFITPDNLTNFPKLCIEKGVSIGTRIVAELTENGEAMTSAELQAALGIPDNKTDGLRKALQRGVKYNGLVKIGDRYVLPS